MELDWKDDDVPINIIKAFYFSPWNVLKNVVWKILLKYNHLSGSIWFPREDQLYHNWTTAIARLYFPFLSVVCLNFKQRSRGARIIEYTWSAMHVFLISWIFIKLKLLEIQNSKGSLTRVRHFYSNSELFDYSQNLHVGQKSDNKCFKKGANLWSAFVRILLH